MNRKVEAHLFLIKRAGLITEIKTEINHKLKHNYDDYELKLKVQKYCKSLPKDNYETELAKWYYINTGHRLSLSNPKRFTEKIQWMKLYGFGELETVLVDKYLVRSWIKERIGEEYLIPLIGVWDDPAEIDFNELPSSFVLKGNHGSQMNLIVKNKSDIDSNNVTKKLRQWLSLDFAFCLGGFELQYEKVPRKIIAEKYMVDGKKNDLTDYKFHCFNGTLKYCEVICDRSKKKTIDYYDMNWKHQDFIDEAKDSKVKNSVDNHLIPEKFDEMKFVAKKLCQGFPYVRVDLYQIGGKVYFGEMTFTPSSGADIFTPDDIDFELGKLLELPI